MLPDLNDDGYLPPGVHWTTWEDTVRRFGATVHRQKLLSGLRAALESLRQAGCQTVYIDGSFVTAKENPGDFDACWEIQGVDPTKLDPVLLIFDNKRAAQKAKYLGELFPASLLSSVTGPTYLEFFQCDEDGNRKGIIALDLRRLK